MNRSFIAVIALCLLIALFDFYAARQTPVLMYHFVGTREQAEENSLIIAEETLRKQISWLKKWGYQIYSLREYENLFSGTALPFSTRGVVLTFDDGNRDFPEKVFPILQQEQVPAASFLIWNNLTKQEQGSMSVAQAKILSESPWVTFGSHTLSHPALTELADKELREEIFRSKSNLESALKMPVLYFSYPSGYLNESARFLVKESGYRLAFTTSRKRLGKLREDRLSIPRVKVTQKDGALIPFWWKASGWYSLVESFRFRTFQWVNGVFP